ncbi:uncharacterized protein LOC121377356 [Gigantopelta aegis]|uniref:uncharacterized protein LOC121377356 n=1 Tax=Gigantopelta aegis TaxID=1735272 RepID=UPI001B88C281|nr:uncharacterized protein LOC121377356 [Gigantopelta aegis]
MEKALAAYRRHCQKDVPGESLKLDDISQHSEHTPQVTPRPFHLSLARVSEINPQQRKDPRQRPWTALPNKFDAVRMVAAANMAEPSSKPRQILHVKTLQMGESEVANSGIFHRNHPRDIRKYQSTTALTSKPSATLNAKTNGNVLLSSLSEKLFYSTSHQKRNNKREAWTQSGRTPSTSRYTRPNLHSAYLVVHPDWLSQSMHIQKLSLTTRPFMNNTCFEDSSFVPRRCKSAPPTKH